MWGRSENGPSEMKMAKTFETDFFIFFSIVVFGYCKNIQLIAVFFKSFLAEEAKIVSCAGDFFAQRWRKEEKKEEPISPFAVGAKKKKPFSSSSSVLNLRRHRR